jgi:prolipoprotein diacylglyceryltransferase
MNRLLDRLARPSIVILGRAWPAYRVCGVVGFVLALLLGEALALRRGLSPSVMAALVVASVMSFFTVAHATLLLLRHERLVYYHHQIAIIASSTLLLCLARLPVRACLDVVVLCLGLFLACGRLGCLMVGCCHGRPHRFGVCYRAEHAALGFPRIYVGVRLFPTQLIESLGVLAIVAVGVALVWRGAPAGAAFCWYIVAYGVGRYVIEPARGDAGRAHLGGFSEAQWLSVALVGALALLERAGLLAFNRWHVIAAAALIAGTITISLARQLGRGALHRLRQPRHMMEIVAAAALEGTRAGTPEPGAVELLMTCTTLGIQISSGIVEDASGRIHHYAISQQHGLMKADAARAVAQMILQVRHPAAASELIGGNRGVFHLLVRTAVACAS